MISAEYAVTMAKRLVPAGVVLVDFALTGCSSHGRISADVYLSTQATPRVLSVSLLLTDPDNDSSRAVTVGYRPFELFHRISEVTIGAGRVFSRYDERSFGFTVDEEGLHGSLPIP